MAVPAWASLGSLLPSRLSSTPPVTWDGLGVSDVPCRPSRVTTWRRVPVPRVAGVILPAPAWFAGAGGVCRLLPCGSRGWRGVPGLTPRRAPSAVRGGAMGRLRWDGPRHRGLLLRTVWATPPSAQKLRGISRVVPPCAVTLQLLPPPRPVCGRLVDPW